ncbi:MAG: lipopolysaccharide assembly protein LapB [Gammaproteobacteria bacterium]|nr:lipopolysaccharide assembly protein LapB [Gammaproteobacteria bacterium]
MDNVALYVLFVLALGIGFLLGRRERRRRKREAAPMMIQDYFQGLNYLLNEQPDLAIETFIDSLGVNNDTVDTHLALGALVRRRGEVDKAIRIHQNILARPVLSKHNRGQAELELARDYLLAGLLGRAESLLLDLAKGGELKITALEHLLEIYQRERDWKRAEAIGRQLLGRNDKGVRTALAHYLCEMAETTLVDGDIRGARQLAARANDYDGRCFRVGLITARIEFEAKRYREVLKNLRRARDYRPELAAETLELFRDSCIALAAEDDYIEYLEESVEKAPELPLVEALAAHRARTEGAEAACKFLGEQLLRRPSLKGLGRLIAEYEDAEVGVPHEYIHVVRTFAESLAARRPLYRCKNCGFAGRSLLWQCPSCHTWDRFEPVHDMETELTSQTG